LSVSVGSGLGKTAVGLVAPTPETLAPSKPPCEEVVVSDICIAIDNSGSVCTTPGQSAQVCDTCNRNQCAAGGRTNNGLCCGNYRTLTDFATSYVDMLPTDSIFSVLKFGDDANVIAPYGTSSDEAKTIIASSRYTGGYTHTEDAILKCVRELEDSTNPVIVLLTDGTPTVCNKQNGRGTVKMYTNGCGSSTCNKCNGGSFHAAASRAADTASNNGISIIPAIISSVATDVGQIEELARCPANSDSCNVDDYKGLNVNNLDELDQILQDLVTVTECSGNGEEEPACPPGNSTKQPWNACTQYYQCRNGSVQGNIQTCSEGNLFDVNAQRCRTRWSVDCPI